MGKTVIVQKWEESERGWGTRPDGYSMHRTRDDLRAYLAALSAAERLHNPSGTVPDEYSRPCGTPYEAEVDDAAYAAITGNGSRHWGNNYPGNGGTDGWVPVQPKASPNDLRAQAIAKLTAEERRALGLDK